MEIIVLGNGPSVLNNEYGKIIDNFDNVLRINHYRPEFAKYVGTKITTFCTSTLPRKNFPDISDKVNDIIIWEDIKHITPYDESSKLKRITNSTEVETYNKIPKKEISEYLQTNFEMKPFPKAPWPSTGIGILTYLILSKKYKYIYIYGFDGLKNRSKIHYFENVIRGNNGEHSSEKELKFLNHHIKEGILCRLEDSEFVPVKEKKIITVNSTDHVFKKKGMYFNFDNIYSFEYNQKINIRNKNGDIREIIVWPRLNGSTDPKSNAHGRYSNNPSEGDFEIGYQLEIL